MPIPTIDKLRTAGALMQMVARLHQGHRSGSEGRGIQTEGVHLSAGVEQAAAPVVALLALAHRGVYPADSAALPWAATVRKLHECWFNKEAVADETRFASVLAGSFISTFLCPHCISPLPAAITGMDLHHLDDPLLTGWAHQSSIKLQADRTSSPASTSTVMSQIEYYRQTQWFTPAWIAEFLVEKTIASYQDTFLDPACGAGHVYLPALARIMALKDGDESAGSNDGPIAAVEHALGQVVGCDIDPFLVKMAGFSTYLFALDRCGIAELPLPRLVCISETETASSISRGALLLGCDEREKAVLTTIDDMSGPCQELLPDCFDAIATNPPYMSHRSMPPPIKELLSKYYQTARYDLYTGFLELSNRLLKPAGRLAMICQQSFLSITRFEEFRRELFGQCQPSIVIQLGPGAFAAKTGEKANNAIVVLQKKDDFHEATSLSGLRILSRTEKELAEREGLARYLSEHGQRAQLEALSQISGQPLSFWCPDEIAALFRRHPPLESKDSGIICVNGLFTCNNDRFIKPVWQVREDERQDYVAYDKGGGHKWFRITPHALRWLRHGDEIRQYRESRGQSRSLPGEAFYFRTGVTYSYINTRGFKARLLSPGAIFDIASSAVFSTEIDPLYTVGFLNSALARFLLGVLNPTINFQIGDLRRLPFQSPDRETLARLSAAAARAIDCAKKLEDIDPSGTTLKLQFLRGSAQNIGSYAEYLEQCEALDAIEEGCQHEVDQLIFDLYGISDKARQRICHDAWVVRGQQRLCNTMSKQQYERSVQKLNYPASSCPGRLDFLTSSS